MTIEADEKLDFIWYHDLPGGGNYLGAMKKLDAGLAELTWRFWHNDGGPDARWYTMQSEREKLLEIQRQMMDKAKRKLGVRVYEIERESPGPEGTDAMFDKLQELVPNMRRFLVQ